SRSLTVTYSATPAGAALARVDLYAKGPGDSGYTKVAGDTTPHTSGSFSFQAPTDGTYRFYTIAVDAYGNAEDPPSDADAVTLVDTQAPSSSASASAASGSRTFSVSFSASDGANGSGLAKVDLYAKTPSGSTFTKVATNSSPGASGSFTYTAATD